MRLARYLPGGVKPRPREAVLYAGSTLGPVMLPGLYPNGYRRLWRIDRDHRRPLRKGPIVYEHGDHLTQTRFADGTFEALLAAAPAYGFRLEAPVDLECQEKAVHWLSYDLRFKFCCFILTKAC